ANNCSAASRMRSTVSDWAMALCLTNERLKHTYQAHRLSSEAFTLWPDSHETCFQMIDQHPYTSYLAKISGHDRQPLGGENEMDDCQYAFTVYNPSHCIKSQSAHHDQTDATPG
ncbi:hypothetical protein, partial [Pseudomonas syringae]|uniref:hypothetical protein n=1 Tax=Pseudomonas syringae TaxID=317 RepID=UPI001C80ABEF